MAERQEQTRLILFYLFFFQVHSMTSRKNIETKIW